MAYRSAVKVISRIKNMAEIIQIFKVNSYMHSIWTGITEILHLRGILKSLRVLDLLRIYKDYQRRCLESYGSEGALET